jgi:hypothetical protein
VRNDRALALLLLLSAPLCACSSTDSSERDAPRLSEAELSTALAEGRALLDAGQPAQAETVFARAAAADGESLRTRMWVLRSWMDQGRSNETLDALDALDRAGEKGTEMTYLYGMAFARRAEGLLADGITDSSVQMNFIDAASYLEKAVEADAARYRDAYLPLARSAWYAQDLEKARWSVERAVATSTMEASAGAAEAWLLRGRIAMAQFASAEGEEAGSPAAETLWSEATDSFRHAVASASAATDAAEPTGLARLADAATQLGHALLWRQRGAEATEAYAIAMAAAPQTFDYARCVEFLRALPPDLEEERPLGFAAALEQARERLGARAASTEERATLTWWLGWARFVDADWEGSETAFQEAIAGVPEFANSWFYIGLARQYRKDSEGALAAMRTGWGLDPAAMVATAASAGGALRAFEALLAWCASQEPPRNLDAAFLAEMLAEAMPDEVRHWNNLGLFLRDEGERLEYDAYKNKTPEPDAALLADLYGRSMRAYQRALELTPEDPQLINDTALMLDYHFEADAADVEALYRRALELVDALLAAPDLSEEDRARFEQTKSDIDVNLKRLLEPEAEKDGAKDEAKAPEGGAATAAAPAGGE